jgi:NADPH:quinone reductase-like Zn-dependent oxidoreductase
LWAAGLLLPNFRMGEYGVYADRAVVPASSLVAPPPGLGPVEAASVWMQFFTAFGIVQAGHLTLGDFVLIPAASSSVGLAAIQIANWLGAEPIALTRTSAKRAALQALGARHVIASSECDVAAEVLRITGGRGAKVVFDPVGGPFVETLAKAMCDEGILIVYGSLSGAATPYPHWSAALKGLSLRGCGLADLESSAALLALPRTDPARPCGWPPAPGRGEDIRTRRHRRGAPLPGIEPAGGQGHRDHRLSKAGSYA